MFCSPKSLDSLCQTQQRMRLNSLLTSVPVDFFCKQDYKFKLTCASPPRTIILLLYSEFCCWWTPSHLVFYFHWLSRVFCQFFIIQKSLAFLNYYYYYICLLSLIRLEFLNIFCFFSSLAII